MQNLKLSKMVILVPLLFGLNVAEAGYQLRMYTPGTVAPTCSDPWGGSLNIGQSVTAYRVGAVNYDQSCQSESRSCQNGALTGSYTFQACAVQTAQDCNLQGYVVTHNHGVFAYSAPTVAYNSSCDAVKETRTCTNGNLSGSFTNTTCSVTPELSCTFNGATVTSAAPVEAYSASTVPFGTSCDSVKETRACTNGVLSGSFTHPTCAVAPSCTPGSQTYATAGTFTFTPPQGCSTATLTAKVWGAGGGGFGNTATTGTGGGGGFANGTTTLINGPVTVVVGEGGSGGTGGGASAVLLGSSEVAVGGGGGGGNYVYYVGWGPLYAAGYPGGAANSGGGTGHAGTAYTGGSTPARTGGASSYGAGAGSVAINTTSYVFYTGGGGGGYVGGIYNSGNGVGTGGSSYALAGTTIGGSGLTPGNTADSAYLTPAGVGAATGKPGRVVLTWE